MKKAVIGILAHVDAGKTTLSEALLYKAGSIRKLGRVDNRDAFLDNNAVEKERGITVFSKQARLSTEKMSITLLDTPGHVDFSSEAERTLQVLDYAILVVSGTDGIQSHTETIWKLLSHYNVPVFIFFNKMDLDGSEKEFLLKEVKKNFGDCCVDFSVEGAFSEDAALCDEAAAEEFFETEKLSEETLAKLIKNRKIFPCFFGSALKLGGIDEFIGGLEKYIVNGKYGADFGARIYKISRDEKGERLTFLKITGGSLKVRDSVSYDDGNGKLLEEKISRIRLYSGAKYEVAEEVGSGEVCAVCGLTAAFPGEGIGAEKGNTLPVLEPVLTYRIKLPENISAREAMPKFLQLSEEDPQLNIVWDERIKEIHVRLMGEVQTEILKKLVTERFDMDIEIDGGKIIYKETIAAPVEGIGHFEPLRHYAEVHLLLEPAEPGSGITISSECKEDLLDRNWQHLILTHIAEKTHRGVLIGALLTDVKITLLTGRAHLKHTEGGDFRQATYRAIRQGLMKAESILLEPYYSFKLRVPSEHIGRAINDIKAMSGSFSSPLAEENYYELAGHAPASEIRSYLNEVRSYTKGKGSLSLDYWGFAPCHIAEKVIAESAYDPEADLENTPDSVFCAHGAGFNVKWNEVENYMHLGIAVNLGDENGVPALTKPAVFARNLNIDEKELEAIMEREFGPIKRRQYTKTEKCSPPAEEYRRKKEYLIVDGYNIIYAWEGLKKLAEDNFDFARHRLTEVLCNYHGYTKCETVLVFDGYKVKGNAGERFDYNGIHIVYTKENETADMYIEKLVNEIGKNYSVRVATSDNLIQVAALSSGVLRMSAKELLTEINYVDQKIREVLAENKKGAFRPFEKIKDNRT